MSCAVVDGYIIYISGKYPSIQPGPGAKVVARKTTIWGEIVISVPPLAANDRPHFCLQLRTMSTEHEAAYYPPAEEGLEQTMEIIVTAFQKWAMDVAMVGAALEQRH
jgi:hypothetical protein